MLPNFGFLAATISDESNKNKNDKSKNCNNCCDHIQKEILRPAEVMSDWPHAGVVRMPQEILQPPDRPLQRMLRLVHDEITQPRHRALVLRVIKDLGDGGKEAVLGHLVPSDLQPHLLVDHLLDIDALVPLDRNAHNGRLVADCLLDAARAPVSK